MSQQTKEAKTKRVKLPISINDLPDDHRVKAIYERLISDVQDLNVLIPKIQEACHHPDWEKIEEYDHDYDPGGESRSGMWVYTGRKCVKCKKFEPRKPGFPHEVCHNCGGDMDLECQTPDIDRTKFYKCKTCGHYVQRI